MSHQQALAPLLTTASSLAPELCRLIFKHVDQRGLKSLRQVKRSWSALATEQLFRKIHLSPSPASIKRWDEILSNETFRRLPRHITIQTQKELEDGEDYANHLSKEFITSIDSIARLPNLVSLELSFSPHCLGNEQSHSRYRFMSKAELMEVRSEFLWVTFTAIQNRAADEANQPIRNLTITNLQNLPIPEFTASELFRSVMKDLDELHLQITREHYERAPDHDYDRIELQTFPGHLCTDWLAPIARQLKALTIGMDTENWGPLPGYFAPTDLKFSNLKTLCLRYYTLAHHDQFDWVLAQTSLKTLVLQNCMITSRLRLDPEVSQEWNLKQHDWQSFTTEDDDLDWPCYEYDGTWAAVFDKITESLPSLENFTFNYNTKYQRLGAKLTGNTGGSRLFPERYVVFDHGILPTHWPEANTEGHLCTWSGPLVNLHEDHFQEDHRGLDALLKACWKRSGGK